VKVGEGPGESRDETWWNEGKDLVNGGERRDESGSVLSNMIISKVAIHILAKNYNLEQGEKICCFPDLSLNIVVIDPFNLSRNLIILILYAYIYHKYKFGYVSVLSYFSYFKFY
jgi:hypothetical protein